ncbi:uncharacterized protein LOC122852284 isoform X2 [Aphidius gifuensis]|uniref:uncharacterized protein LOC122852284 isoform X2 n=1 Tax=Aphidius gifuensis TaxID=684658 RepID=UPI001CDD8108|nr:uncharacterized protein LOC122852284 isoform X2 [Aphidius gifuensis]
MERTRINERLSYDNEKNKLPPESEFGIKKTILVLAVVAGCFAILWPKIFYPMIIGPSSYTSTDKSVCCDLIFENDVNTADILQEMCKNIIKHHQIDPRIRDVLKTNKLTLQSSNFCRDEILARCGIDMSSFLADKERLGKSHKQVLEEIRSFNSSICLKNHYGVSLSKLGIPHLIRYHILMPHTPIRQERKAPIHAGNSHPAMRERGRAIPASHIVPKVDGRPDHVVPKMRPPMGGGGGGRVIMSSQGGGGGGGSSMGIIMPLYTVGILVFFLYTMAKVLRKNSKNEIHQDYRNIEAEREFRNRVFNPAALASAITGAPYPKKEKTPVPAKPIKTIEELKSQSAGEIEVDMLLRRLADTEAAMERIVVQMGNFSRTIAPSPDNIDCNDENCCQMQQNDNEKCELPCGIKMSGIKTTAYSKSERKISRPTTPVIPQSKKDDTEREQTSTNEVFLEGTIPPNCDLFVLDTETQEEENSQCGIILSSKVTLSLIDHNDNLFIKGEKNGDIYVKKKKNKPEFENGKNKKVDEEDEEDEDDDEEFITAKQDKSRDEIEEDEEDADLRTENNPFTLSDHHYEMKKKFDDEQNDIDSDEISNEIEDDDDQLDNDNLIVNMKEENKFKSMKIENIERNKNKKIEEVEDDASEDEESPKNKR